jgi:hypothetical protein
MILRFTGGSGARRLSQIWRSAGCQVLIVAAWILAVVAVNPIGDFPMLDDWSYAASVHALVYQGRIWFSDWGATNLISLVFWGAMFTKLFGFSYTVLHASALLLTLLGNLALFSLLRAAGGSRLIAVLATLCVMFNPVSFFLSFAFMTDNSYTAFQTFAMLLIVTGAQRRSRVRSVLGWIVAAVAQLCRQIAVGMAIGAAAARLVRVRPTPRLVLAAAAPIIFIALVQTTYKFVIHATGVASRLYGYQANGIVGGLLQHPLGTTAHGLRLSIDFALYLGLFLLPLTVASARQWARGFVGLPWALGASLAGVAVAVAAGVEVAKGRWLFPGWGDILNRWAGVGPERVGTPPPELLQHIAGGLAGAGAVLLALAIVGLGLQWWRKPAPESGLDTRVLGLGTALVLLAPVALTSLSFDRYLIPVIPCLCLALIPFETEDANSRPWLAAGFALALAMGLFSTLSTHDYIAWKRVQAGAFQDLRRTIPVANIDAGWVLNGSVSDASKLEVDQILKWRAGAEYLIGSKVRPGYQVIKTYPVPREAPWNQGDGPLLIERRVAATGVQIPAKIAPPQGRH